MNSRPAFRRSLLAALLVASAVAHVPVSQAAEPPRQAYDIEGQDLDAALRIVARSAGREILAPSDLVAGRRAPTLKGLYSADEAVDALLRGSGLTVDRSTGAFVIRGRDVPSPLTQDAATGTDIAEPRAPDIVVTGTRIRGGASASPVIVQTQKDIRDAGQTDLGEAARSLPQSFSGGQNPGVAASAGGVNNQNTNSASSFNLRGLGPDATLTLLNGHRLAYDSIVQAIDVSAIPLAAVDRVEIVADGASALYGSDAVGGVANVILRRDYDGLETSARLGVATRGGDRQQQYSIVAGKTWSSGGLIAAGEFGRSTAIDAKDRSFTASEPGGTTLLPFQKHEDALVSGHQTLNDRVELDLDLLYNGRASSSAALSQFAAGYSRSHLRSFALAPELKVELGGGWKGSLSGTYGQDRSHLVTDFFILGNRFSHTLIDYDNNLGAGEASAEGPLIALPGGNARLALGAGYRSNRLASTIDVTSPFGAMRTLDISHARDSYYGFGELYLPFVAADQGVRGVARLTVTAALRYERYPGMAQLATPKLGGLYAPSPDLDVKASWGKSFKTPTLFQQYENESAILTNANDYGTPRNPRATTALFQSGGNSALKPEKATTWSATVALHPRALTGLRVEASSFNIHYRNRITEPIVSSVGIFGNPVYQRFIGYDPSQAALDAVIARAPAGLQNYSDYDYDPATIAAIIDDRFVNLARQTIHGVDLLASYKIDTGGRGSITLNGNASYLHSNRRLHDDRTVQQLAGTIFDPPHWRGRAGLVWEPQQLTVAVFANYIGSVTDDRFAPAVRVGSMTTFDLTARVKLPERPAFLHGSEIALSATNLFDARPRRIRTLDPSETPYDSTNQSAIGRYLSLSVTKRW